MPDLSNITDLDIRTHEMLAAQAPSRASVVGLDAKVPTVATPKTTPIQSTVGDGSPVPTQSATTQTSVDLELANVIEAGTAGIAGRRPNLPQQPTAPLDPETARLNEIATAAVQGRKPNLPVESPTTPAVDESSETGYNSGDSHYAVDTSDSLFGQLFTKDDPARDYFGSAKQSHPKELAEIVERIEKLGVKIVYREGTMSYQPSPVSGKPGQVVIEPDASYSAWKHEEKHVLDDYEAGWLGFRLVIDPKQAALMEKAAYDIEIELAKQDNLVELMEKLEELKKKEMREYYE